MLSLAALDSILGISEGKLIEDILVTLMAAPQLVVFFEKYPRLKQAMMRDIPRWREKLQQRSRDIHIPQELEREIL